MPLDRDRARTWGAAGITPPFHTGYCTGGRLDFASKTKGNSATLLFGELHNWRRVLGDFPVNFAIPLSVLV